MSYLLVFLLVGVGTLFLTILRTNITYSRELTSFFGNGSIRVVHPCAIIINFICLIFLLLFAFNLPYIHQSLDKMECSREYIKEIVLSGRGDWAGMTGIVTAMEDQIKMLNVIEQMPAGFLANTSFIERRLTNHSSFASGFLNLYGAGEVRMGS